MLSCCRSSFAGAYSAEFHHSWGSKLLRCKQESLILAIWPPLDWVRFLVESFRVFS